MSQNKCSPEEHKEGMTLPECPDYIIYDDGRVFIPPAFHKTVAVNTRRWEGLNGNTREFITIKWFCLFSDPFKKN